MMNFKKEKTPLIQILISLWTACCLLPLCRSQESNANATLTSTESTITLQWEVDPNATLYQVSYQRNGGFIFSDAFYELPFESTFLTYRSTGLLPGMSYIFLLFKNGNHSSDRVFFGSVPTIPLPPENLDVLNRTSESLLLAWEPGYNSSQEFYEIQYYAQGSPQVVQANVTYEPFIFNLTDLMPGYTYVLSVSAVSHNARSNSSDSLTTVTAPAMPANLNVTAVNSTTLLATWENRTNSIQDSFVVTFSVDAESTERSTNCTSSPCEFSVGGVPGELYTIFVYAMRETFRSKPAVTQHNTVPAPPENLNGVSRVRALTLTWSVPSQGVFDSFYISLKNAFENTQKSYDVPKQGDSTVYSYPVTALVGGVSYFVRVHSVTRTQNSTAAASDLYISLPEPVTGLLGEALNTTAVKLSWNNPFKTKVTGLELNLTSGSGPVLFYSPSPGESSGYAIGGLHPGLEYTAVVVVQSKVQVDSAPVNTTVRTKPEMPQLVTFESKEKSLEVTLSGGEDLNGIFDSIKAKLVEEETLLTADDQGMVKFPNLTPGMQYTLSAYTISGDEASTFFTQVFYTKPRPPQNLQVDTISSEELNITWEHPDMGGVDNYTVTLIHSHGVGVPTEVVVNGLNFFFTDAQPGETYNVTLTSNRGTESSSAIMQQNTTIPSPLEHVWVSMKGIDFAVITWDTPVGSVYDGFAYDFKFLNKTLEELGPDPLNVRLESLDANGNYTVSLYVFSRRVDGSLLYSQPVSFNFSTSVSTNLYIAHRKRQQDFQTQNPESVAALQKVDATSDSITVNWTAPLSGRFSSYQLGINPQDSPNSIINATTNQSENTFTGLQAGKNYTVAIRTVINWPRSLFGPPVRLQAVTSPLPVKNLTVVTVSADQLRVSWRVNLSESNQDRFIVYQEKDSVQKSKPVPAVNGLSQYEETLDQLLSGHTYTITVVAIREIDTDIEESQPTVSTGTTKPKPVEHVFPTASNQAITVTWQPAAGSQQETYRIKYRPVLRNPAATWLEQTATTNATQIPGIFPGEKYEISVTAISSGQESDPSNATIVVAPLPPSVSVNLAMTTTSSVTLVWTYNPAATYVEYWSLTYSNVQMTESLNVTSNGLNDIIQQLTPLISGMTYSVEIKAVVQDVYSEMILLNVTARPVININIREISLETSNTDLSFEYNVSPDDFFDEFRFSLSDVGGVSPVIKAKSDTDHKVKFSGLTAGQVYTVVAVTISAGVVSDPVTKNILTEPNNVDVSFQNKSDQIVVIFDGLVGQATKYRVQCYTADNSSCWNEEVNVDASNLPIANLQPYTTYTITVTTIAGGAEVTEKSVTKLYSIRTLEDAPTEVRQVRATENGLRTVQLRWLPPLTLNGVLNSYQVEYMGTHSNGGNDSRVMSLDAASPPPLVLENLKAGYTYVFKVRAKTIAWGPAGEYTVTLSTTKPDFKMNSNKENSKPMAVPGALVRQTAMSVTLNNAFSDKNGPIIGQVVIVSRDPNVQLNEETLPSWSDVQKHPDFVAYQATDKCPDLFRENSMCGKSQSRSIRAVNEKDTVVFEVGVQSAAECSKLVYCNGPLQPGTDYYIKLRAFTKAGFSDTAFSGKVRTADAPDESSSVVIGVVVGVVAVVVIAAVIVLVVVIRIRRRPKRATKYRGPPSATGRTSLESSSLQKFRESRMRRFREVRARVGLFAMHLLHVNEAEYGTEEQSSSIKFDRKSYRTFDRHVSRPVKLIDFPDHVQKMAADSDFKYAEEYEDLKEVGRDQVCHAAELPVNRPKNRFTNILPYDHSRVKLLPTDDEEGSDYINANYMPGYTSKREYIATQGPLPATRDDFWRMVWEQNSRNIVMLTKCMEKGREKSDHYWPGDAEPKFYGDLQVVILNETHMPDWTITEFRMCLGDNCRQVRHFHYKAWPDFGVPKNHSSLIRFVRTVREKLIKDGGPIVTHCSAGVGRSGTFIVLDHCLRLVKDKDEVDIFSIVYSLRRERVLMVQTEQQYKFIHECLLCVLDGREDETTYANIGQVNVGFEADSGVNDRELEKKDDEGINVEVPT